MKTCACGCGRDVKGRGRYYHGHRPKETIEDVRDRPCECGCGQPLRHPRNRSSRYYQARFLPGHHVNLMATPPHTYTPKSEEIPSGICECGCGKPTPVCGFTSRPRRHFRGHPAPFIAGHHRDIPLTQRKKFIGRRVKFGYVYVYSPEHPAATKSEHMLGWVLEHRLVWEGENGRLVPDGWHVHHMNGIRDDNRPENLLALSQGEHRRLHLEHLRALERTVGEGAVRNLLIATGRAWADGKIRRP